MLLHSWDVTPSEAIAIQERLRGKVLQQDCYGDIRSIAGVDVGFEAGGSITRAAIVLMSYPALQVTRQVVARLPTTFPYIPGLLSFREAPAILNGLELLGELPDMLMCDGQGFAHPRRFGLACHLGVFIDLPSIGVAKSRLVGQHASVGETRGDWQPLLENDELIGAVLRTRQDVKPVYVSIGHRVSLQTAISLVMNCTTKYRLPEPVRAAHLLSIERG